MHIGTNFLCTTPRCLPQWGNESKLAIHLSFLAFRHVRALFRELFCEIANQSLYTFHNIADFSHLSFCEKLALSSSLTFCENTIVWQERRNARWEKWLARWFTKCHLYTSYFSRFTNIFSRSCQFDDKCIAGLRPLYLNDLLIHTNFSSEIQMFH